MININFQIDDKNSVGEFKKHLVSFTPIQNPTSKMLEVFLKVSSDKFTDKTPLWAFQLPFSNVFKYITENAKKICIERRENGQ